jgi:hypothetical protein
VADRDRWKLEEVAAEQQLQPTEWLAQASNRLRHTVQLGQEVGINHRDLVEAQHFGLPPSMCGGLIGKYPTDKPIQFLLPLSHASPAVDGLPAHVDGSDASRCSHGDTLGAMDLCQLFDDSAEKERLTGARCASEEAVLAADYSPQCCALLRVEAASLKCWSRCAWSYATLRIVVTQVDRVARALGSCWHPAWLSESMCCWSI